MNTSAVIGCLPQLSRRVLLTEAELRLIYQLSDAGPPWRVPPPRNGAASRIGHRLSGAFGTPDSPPAGTVTTLEGAQADNPWDSLLRRGLVRGGGPQADGVRLDGELKAALQVTQLPDVMVDLDLLHATRAGFAQLRSWHRARGSVVIALSTVDGEHFELSWFALARWPDELARVATLHNDKDVAHAVDLAEVVEMPLEALLVAGPALAGRPDLYPGVLERWAGGIRESAGARLEPEHEPAHELGPAANPDFILRHFAGQPLTRLQGAVMTPDQARPVGIITWIADNYGWWELEPRGQDGVRLVRASRTSAEALPQRVGSLLPRVLGRWAA